MTKDADRLPRHGSRNECGKHPNGMVTPLQRLFGHNGADAHESIAAIALGRFPLPFATTVLLGVLIFAQVATGGIPAKIEKTFDFSTLIEHTVTAERGPYRATLRLSQRRASEGSSTIVDAHLTYASAAADDAPLMTASVFEFLLADMMNAIYGQFGTDLKLNSLVAAGYMGIKEIEKRAILAFDAFAPWEAYLEAPQQYPQQQIHAIVTDRWRAEGVFDAITAAFAPLGYRAVFAGFEKLFVFPAEKCSFYPELEDLGIRKTDRFPYPGTIAFTLMPNP